MKEEERKTTGDLEAQIEKGLYLDARITLENLKSVIPENKYREYLNRIEVEERDY